MAISFPIEARLFLVAIFFCFTVACLAALWPYYPSSPDDSAVPQTAPDEVKSSNIEKTYTTIGPLFGLLLSVLSIGLMVIVGQSGRSSSDPRVSDLEARVARVEASMKLGTHPDAKVASEPRA